MLALLAQVVLSPDDALRIAEGIERMYTRNALIAQSLVSLGVFLVCGAILVATQNQRVKDSDKRAEQLVDLAKELGADIDKNTESNRLMLRAIEENRRVLEELVSRRRRYPSDPSKPISREGA